MKLVIGNKNYSSWSMRPWLLLKHHGLAFEEYRIALFSDGFKSEISSISGAGKVPVLIDGGSVIWDSLAICEYISEAHLEGKGYPEDLHDRALARAVSSEMHSGFFNIREKMPLNCRATGRQVEIDDELKKEIDRIDAMWCELRDQFSHKGPWLLGQFSIVDCMFAPVALRFRTYGVTLSEVAENYKSHVLQDNDVQQWVEAGAAESEVLSVHEVG